MIDLDKIPAEAWKRMNISRERFAEIQKVLEEREKKAPSVGSAAPDFALRELSRDRRKGDQRIRLADLRGRPVALIFGSYT